ITNRKSFRKAFMKQKSFEKTAFSQSKKKTPLYDECSPAKAIFSRESSARLGVASNIITL
ncbi:hypothetical protein ACPTHM_14215, partial [Enterococcus faecalis]|uniref:hypothetical protein n=1 Tax=Enterococcus faecalis TaxID=1351 RepID=UPI003CC5EDD2